MFDVNAYCARPKLKQSLLLVPRFDIHSRRFLATMAASDSPCREEESSHSSQAENAQELRAHGVGNSELEAGKPKASLSIATAAAAKKSANKSKGTAVALAGTTKESTLQKELTAARARSEEANKKGKMESKAVRNVAKTIERIKQKAKALSNNDLMEVYVMRTQEEAKKEGKITVAKKGDAK